MTAAADSAARVAVVTGGSAGIGKAICADLLGQGYEVVSLARRSCDLDHPKLHSIEVDLTDRAATAEAVAGLAGRFDVTTVVHNAGVIRAAEEAGLRVPEDVSVTGFDGIVVDGLAPYELTTLVQPVNEKGRAAGMAVAAMLDGAEAASITFTCDFREGNTTGPAPA